MYLQRLEYSEEELAQLEEAASLAQVVKVEVDVGSDRASCVLAAGFRKYKVLREVTLSRVPSKELVDSVERTLNMNTALTTVVVK